MSWRGSRGEETAAGRPAEIQNPKLQIPNKFKIQNPKPETRPMGAPTA